MLDIILLIAACISFGLAAFNVISSPRVNFVALGLLFWCITVLV